jgi:molecular chaperone GrpE (heat shock protein)
MSSCGIGKIREVESPGWTRGISIDDQPCPSGLDMFVDSRRISLRSGIQISGLAERIPRPWRRLGGVLNSMCAMVNWSPEEGFLTKINNTVSQMYQLNVKLLADEFQIDEELLEVFTEDVESVKPKKTDDEESSDTVSHLFNAYKGNDLISEMATLMIQQHELIQKAKLMELNRSGDDEFGRFVRQLLPFLDNFNHVLDKAREHEGSDEIQNWLKSVEALYYRITSLLDSFELRFVSALGKPVNLDFQEVIEYRTTDQYKNDAVIHEIQRAAVFRGRLLREAKVVVAYNEDVEEEAEAEAAVEVIAAGPAAGLEEKEVESSSEQSDVDLAGNDEGSIEDTGVQVVDEDMIEEAGEESDGDVSLESIEESIEAYPEDQAEGEQAEEPPGPAPVDVVEGVEEDPSTESEINKDEGDINDPGREEDPDKREDDSADPFRFLN